MATNFTNSVISAIELRETKYRIKSVPFHATEAEWLSIDYVPKQAELIVYDPDTTHNYYRFKTGDGETQVNLLPFSMASWSEIEIFINSQIASAGHLKRTVLGADEELPEVNKADIDTIYMKPYANGVVSDFYEEYMVINGAWEIIGNTFVDLSNYLQEITVG